jgi:hypothetical protein
MVVTDFSTKPEGSEKVYNEILEMALSKWSSFA